MIENRLYVLILQHPQERRQALATADVVAAVLARARITVGLSWSNLAKALGRAAEPRRWAVLYLGSARPASTSTDDTIVALDRDGEAIADAAGLVRGLDGIVLLDGTWSQAKNLWWRNPWLLKLYRLVLVPRRPARFGRLRREPRREALSTLEAAALVLRSAESGAAAADALIAELDRLIAAARPAAHPRVRA